MRSQDFGQDMNIILNWAKHRWVYVYVFSDEANTKRGFGAFVSGYGAEYFESTQNAYYDMDQHSSDKMRIGSRNGDDD